MHCEKEYYSSILRSKGMPDGLHNKYNTRYDSWIVWHVRGIVSIYNRCKL